MEYQEKVAWLRRYQAELDTECRLRDKIRMERSRAESTTQALSPICGGENGKSDKVADGVEILAEYQTQLTDQLKISETVRAEIEQSIFALDDYQQRDVLLAHYVDGLQWWKVANRLYISERWAKSLHKKAIENLKLCTTVHY